MMIHDKLVPNSYLYNTKNESAAMLHATATHHQPQQQIPTPPMDIYASYLYQQQFIASNNLLNQSNAYREQTAEVLDLSKRCDTLETPQTPRKTPSPCHTNSSITSPFSSAGSPSQCEQLLTQREHGIPANLIYSAQAQCRSTQQQQTGINLASLYPALYCPPYIKEEPNISSTSSTPPLIAPAPTITHAAVTPLSQLPHAPNTSFLQTIAAAAAATSAHVINAAQQRHPICSPHQHTASSNNSSTTALIATPNSPTSSNALLAASDVKSTPRPFKAFHRDPLVIAANFTATDALLDNHRIERYAAFRKRVLKQMKESNGGSRTVSNPKMRRTQSPDTNSTCEERSNAEESSDCDISVGNLETNGCATATSSSNALDHENDTDSNERNSFNSQVKDAAYYERRRKNNAAAKKSRDRRRIKEDEIAIRASYLERQNIELLCQIDALKAQLATFTAKLHT